MKINGAKKQTMLLTGINGIVRALGLLMRVVLSRLLGAEVMGIMELAQSVHMVFIVPITSGLPAAVSRLSAKAHEHERFHPLQSAVFLVRLFSAAIIPLLWLCSPIIGRLMGDIRVLPSLWFSAPCILILGYSAACNGYCYGNSESWIPAFSELIEQICRVVFTFIMLHFLHSLTAAWLAAVPVIATMIAEIIGLGYVMKSIAFPAFSAIHSHRFIRPVISLASPVTLSRLIQTLIRSITAILIPLQLQKSGLSPSESTARLGMLNGMVMPILFLPCIFTSALSMVILPRITQAEQQPSELRRLLLKGLAGCIPFSAVCSAAIYACAPLLSIRVFGLAELTALFRLCAPMTFLLSLEHLTANFLSALGQQKQSLFASCMVSVITLALTWLLTAQPQMRIEGVVAAQYAGHLTCLGFDSYFLYPHLRKSVIPCGRSV